MEYIEDIVQPFKNTIVSLSPFFPLLIFGIVTEKFWAKYKVENTRIMINLMYVILALTLAHTVVLPQVYRLNAFIPVDYFRSASADFSPMQNFLFWGAYIVLFDFLYYWFHRSQHTFRWMWRYHMVHHSDKNISVSAFARHHWLEGTWRYAFITAPIFVFFGSERAPFFVIAFVAFFAIWMHWNTPLRFGYFEKLVITPNYHRIHHSIESHHYDKNFGSIFQIWDYMFGTRYLPEEGEFPKTGIKGFSEKNFFALLAPWPLVYASEKHPEEKK